MADSPSGLKYRLDYLLMKLGLLGTENIENINLNFLVSTGRTGTKFLARFFNKYSDTYALHEPRPDFLKEGIDFARGKLKEDRLKKILSGNRQALFKKIKRLKSEHYVESNNRLFSMLEPLKDIYPGARVVHIVRDGRDYVRSGMSRAWYKKQDTTYRLRADFFPKDPYYEKWDEMSRFQKICWRWQKKDGFIYRSLKNINNAITVKYEEIFNDDDFKGLHRIADYIEMDKDSTEKLVRDQMENKINATREYEIPHWRDWGAKRIKEFNEIAGKHMENYYSPSS
ncbi:MAG: sulfotransferase [Elusimicrobiota bacterium]